LRTLSRDVTCQSTRKKRHFSGYEHQYGTGLRLLGVRINSWNGREDRQSKTTGVVEGMNHAERNCRCVRGRN